jgi:hypothetical protein
MQVAIKRGTEPEDGGDHRTLSPKVPMTEDGVTSLKYPRIVYTDVNGLLTVASPA